MIIYNHFTRDSALLLRFLLTRCSYIPSHDFYTCSTSFSPSPVTSNDMRTRNKNVHVDWDELADVYMCRFSDKIKYA